MPTMERHDAYQASLREEQTFLIALSDELRPLADATAIQRTAARLLGEWLGVNRVAYKEIDGDDYVVRDDWTHDVASMTGRGLVADFGEDLIRRCRRGESVVVGDIVDEVDPPTPRAAYTVAGIKSYIIIPLIKAGHWVGALSVNSRTPRRWSDADIGLAIEVAERTWAALERAHAEAVLHESEERFRLVAESGLIAVCFFDDTGTVTDANDAFLAMVHTTRDQIRSRALHTFTLTSESSMARAQRALDEYQRTGEATPFEKEYVRPDGTRFWALVAGQRMSNGRGVGFVLDITERKRAEARQAILSEITKELVDVTDLAVTMGRVAEKIGTHFNAKWCTFLELTTPLGAMEVRYGWNDLEVPSLDGSYRWEGYRSADSIAAQQTGEPMIAHDTTATAGVNAAGYAQFGIRAFIGVPTLRNGQWLFYTWVGDNVPRTWRDDEVALLRELSERIWLRIERVRAEAALRESQQLLATVLEILPVGVGVMDADGAVVLSNAEMRRYLPTGVIASRDAARRWRWRATHPDGRPVDPEDFPTARALRGDAVSSALEILYTQDDGREIWTRVAGVPLRDAEGRVTGAAAAVTDIDVLKRTADALRETQARLEEALAIARMAYWTWDPRKRTTIASHSMDELLGLRDGETFASAHGFEIIHPDDRDAHRAVVERCGARGEGWHVEFRIVRPRDGEVLWLEERATVTRDPVSGAVHTTGLVWDITDRKRAEAAADRDRHERERDALRAALATAEEEERRRLARELHDQLGQHLTAFTLGLADARRLLAQHQSADMRLSQLEGLARLMSQDARYLALELRPPELDDVGLESALHTYAEQWAARYGVAAEMAVTGPEAEKPLPSPIGTAVYRIVQEALTNVAKHAEARQVSVLLERNVGEVRLVVDDNGRGFDVEETEARVRAERRLGLASIRERAALVGGTLDVESNPGRGTAIYVRIPLPSDA